MFMNFSMIPNVMCCNDVDDDDAGRRGRWTRNRDFNDAKKES